MKRATAFQSHVAKKRERRRVRRLLIQRRRQSTHILALERAARDAPLKFIEGLGRKVHVVQSPTKINLSENYDETVEYLEKVRRLAGGLKHRLHVDLTSVQEITPAGALLVVATFDRWREAVNVRRLRPVALEKWNPEVRRKLREMGFFEVLGAKCHIHDVAKDGDDRYLPFLSGSGSEGDQARTLRQKIEEFGPQLVDRGALYDGLVEAMTNVKHHAYAPNDQVKRWWMSASVNVANNRLTVMFLDHGLGIPATLPRSGLWEQARGWLSKLGPDAFKDDAKLIEAALTVERSKTGEDYRGNGLRHDIRGYIDAHQAVGRLRVISRSGKCMYEKSSKGAETMTSQHLDKMLYGTFIEWTIEEYSANENA